MSTSAIGIGESYTPAPRHEVKDPAVEEFYGNLLRGCTHKLNNQLAVIQGFSSLLQMNDDLDPSDRENINHMKDASTSASKLSERVLAAAGISTVTTIDMNLEDMLKMSDSDVRAPFTAAEVPFELQIDSDLPEIKADSSRLKDIIIELLRNAADAAQLAEGSVAMKVQAAGEMLDADSGCLEIIVRNEGDVIPEEKFKEIWDPFYSTRTSEHLGLGLTLASVHATAMKMPLGFKSKDGATTFVLGVPIAA